MSGKAPTSTKHVLLTSSSRSNSDIESGTTNKAQEEEQQASLQSSGSNKKPPRKKSIFASEREKCIPLQIIGQESSPPKTFAPNVIVTSKFTIFNLIPLFLLEQFSRVANVYFLVVSILEMNCFNTDTELFDISLTNGSSSNLPILCMVLFIELITQVLEDRKKHIADATANAKPSRWFNPATNKLEDVKWRDLKVGDLIQVKQGEEFPCDLLLLCGKTKKGGGCQQAYVETKSLDGETNLKLRLSPTELYNIFQQDGKKIEEAGEEAQFEPRTETLEKIKGSFLSCDDPRDDNTSKSIHTFLGNMDISKTGLSSGLGTFPVNEKNVLLRECRLKNTEYVFGLVINTGPDTKVMKSTTESKGKVSDLDRTLNTVLKLFLGIMGVLCFIGAIIAVAQNDSRNKFLAYVEKNNESEQSGTKAFFESFFLYFIGIAQMIPIALYVQLRLARMIQSVLIEWDENMVHIIPPQFSLSGNEEKILTKVRTADLNDELGQVGFIFSDKTGTLTQNIMDFRKMSVAGVRYGKGTTMIGIAALEKDGKMEEAKALKAELIEQENRPDKIPYCSYFDSSERSAYKDIGPKATNKVQKEKIEEFFRVLALCHNVEVEHRGTGLFYSSSSPDEQALVAGAKHFGFLYEDQKQMVDPNTGRKGAFRLIRRAPPVAFDKMPLAEALGKKTPVERWQILEIMEFTSKRKRMSVVVESKGKIKVLIKGADSVVFKRLKASERQTKLFTQTKQDLLAFANDGLRTLAVAYRVVPRAEFIKWKKEFDKVLNDDEQQALKKKQLPNKIDDKMGELERDLILLGATAIEDKLQVGVPDTIADMAKAGINLWVLTGDKEETAINIGFACQLLNTDMPRCIIRGMKVDSNGSRVKTTEEILIELEQALVNLQTRTHRGDLRQQALVIDGQALEIALDDSNPGEPIYEALLNYSTKCKAVIGCRVSPMQKSLMVKLVKDNSPGVKTLSIGDGANDVPMIQQAHIGIGIAGQEGMQAVLASDYAVGQFRFLKRLTLVHGRENYRRASTLVNYMFYKNVLLCIVPFLYKIINGTTEDGVNRWVGVSFFNVFQTGMPVFYLACYDRMCNDDSAILFPRLYKPGPAKEHFNSMVFLRWITESMVHGMVCFVIALHCFPLSDVLTNVNGMLMAWFLATVCNVRVGFEYVRVYTKSFLYPPNTLIIVTLSLLAFPVLFLLYTLQLVFEFGVPDDAARFYGTAVNTYNGHLPLSSWGVWLGFLFVGLLTALPSILVGGFKRRFKPTFLHLVNEYEKVLESGKDPEDAEKKKQFLIDLDAKLWKEECGGDEVETLIRKASTMDRRTSMDLAMKRDGNGHSHSEWELQHTGENFGHDDETAALEAKLARKHIRVATLTDLSKFANKIKQSLSVHHGRPKSGSS